MPCASSAATTRRREAADGERLAAGAARRRRSPSPSRSSWPVAARRRSAAVDRVYLPSRSASVVAGLGRVDQVGGDRRVERAASAGRCPRRASAAHERLGLVGPHTAGRRRARDCTPSSPSKRAGIQATSAVAGSITTARPVSVAAAGLAGPRRRPRRAPRAGRAPATASAGRRRTASTSASSTSPPATTGAAMPARRAPRPADRTACGTRGSRTAA